METLVVPTLDTLRQWLDDMGISFFECDTCQALHIPHMQNFDGVFDAKLDLINDVVLFSALAEVKPSALLALASDLSAINASSLTVKAFLDIQDDNLQGDRHIRLNKAVQSQLLAHHQRQIVGADMVHDFARRELTWPSATN
jgi:hypothetical protein